MGSLFKLRDCWSLKLDEEFSAGGITLANVDNEANGTLKIVLGSFSGVLRILTAKQRGHRAEDVLLEKRFPEPILQVAAGNFLPGNTNRNALAILFPRKLVIASVTRLNGGAKGATADSSGDQPTNFFLQLTVHVEHRFEHTTYNFTHGVFGASRNSALQQEMICVQSMDGQLSIVDHNKIILQRFLPSTHFLVPGLLAYCSKTDSIITNSSSFELHSYRYQTLAQSTGSETKDSSSASSSNDGVRVGAQNSDVSSSSSSSSSSTGRKMAPDWVFNMGEDAVEIQIARLTRNLLNDQQEIIVLSEHTMFVLNADDGSLKYNRRLDAAVSCGRTYLMPDGKAHNLLIGTFTEHVNVYNDTSLQWSAKASGCPLALFVSTPQPLCGVSGMIVMLSDAGVVSVNYLGTDPANNPIQILESKELDYDAMDEEHRRLQVAMRQAVGGGNAAGRAAQDKEFIRIKADASPSAFATGGSRACRVTVQITHSGRDASTTTSNATLITSLGASIGVDQPSVMLPSIPIGQVTTVVLTCFPVVDTDCLIPSTLVADFVLTFQCSGETTLTARTSCLLPLTLVATPVPPLKNAQFKTQIDTNQAPPPSLVDLYSDMTPFGEVSANVLSVQYANGSDATILVSKNAGRFRVQSTSLEGLWLVTSDLIRRLKVVYAGAAASGQQPLRIEIPEGIPLEEYNQMIDMHCLMRMELAASQNRLAEVAHQFRAIQKRLLVRFRDRNPTPLASLELLFEDTYKRLHVASDDVDAASARLRQASTMLSCSTQLVLLLLRYRCQDTMTKADFDLMRHYLSPSVPLALTSTSLGWEEITDANMTHLLRTALSKNSKESNSVPQPLVPSMDGSRVKKHITIVLDRLCKGATLAGNPLMAAEVLEGGAAARGGRASGSNDLE